MNDVALALISLTLVFWWVGWHARQTNRDELLTHDGHARATVPQAVASIFTVIGGGEYGFAIALLLGYGLGGPAFLLGLAAAVLLFRLVATKVWSEARATDNKTPSLDGYTNFTTPDWLATQYGRIPATLGTAITVIAFVALLTLQFVLGGDLISAVTGWPYALSALFMAVIVAVYVSIGGFSALLHTDVWQGIIMWVSLIVVLGYVFIFQPFGGEYSNHAEAFAKLIETTESGIANTLSDPTMLTMLLTTAIAAFAGPDIWQRVSMVGSKEEAKSTLRYSAIAWVIFLIPMTLLARVRPLHNVLKSSIPPQIDRSSPRTASSVRRSELRHAG